MIRIEHLIFTRSLAYVPSRTRARTLHEENDATPRSFVGPEAHALQVQNDVGDILRNPPDGRKFMLNTLDPDRRNRHAFKRGQQDASQRIADRYAIPTLEGLHGESAKMLRGFVNLNADGHLNRVVAHMLYPSMLAGRYHVEARPTGWEPCTYFE